MSDNDNTPRMSKPNNNGGPAFQSHSDAVPALAAQFTGIDDTRGVASRLVRPADPGRGVRGGWRQ